MGSESEPTVPTVRVAFPPVMQEQLQPHTTQYSQTELCLFGNKAHRKTFFTLGTAIPR